MKRIGLLSVALAAALTVACGDRGRDANAARDNTVGTTGTTAADRNISNASRRWLEDRIQDNMAEVRLGELAGQKAQLAEVKAYGREMVQDHTKALDELKRIATSHNVTPPVDVSRSWAGQIDDLTKLKAGEFDRKYVDDMVDDHQDLIKALEDRLDKTGDDRNPQYTPKKADDAFDAELNQWAAKTAPVVHQHLDKARQLKDTLAGRTTER